MFELATNKIMDLFENASNLAPSPDGKTIAFLKRDDKRSANIYLYDIKNKQQSILSTDSTKKMCYAGHLTGKN